jgi:ribosomal protein L34
LNRAAVHGFLNRAAVHGFLNRAAVHGFLNRLILEIPAAAALAEAVRVSLKSE